MKYFTLRLSKVSSAFAIAGLFITFYSCTGPTGPAGPAGTNGTTGCTQCHHDSTDLLSRTFQWQLSTHATGNAFLEADRSTCAGCHTNEGFHEILGTTADTTRTAYPNPTTINCRTCHNIHKTYTNADWALTYTSPVSMRWDSGKTVVDIGKGNLCAKCHQARVLSPPITGTDSITITSPFWGPHNSSQSNILWGTGAFDVSGTGPISVNSTHKTIQDACLHCHMATPIGVGVGGHTFNTVKVDEQTGVIATETAGCLTCHQKVGGTGMNIWDVNGDNSSPTSATKMRASLFTLRTRLAQRGWIDTTGTDGPFSDVPKAPLKLSNRDAKILANYLLIARDNSKGIHNPNYVSAVLAQALAIIQ